MKEVERIAQVEPEQQESFLAVPELYSCKVAQEFCPFLRFSVSSKQDLFLCAPRAPETVYFPWLPAMALTYAGGFELFFHSPHMRSCSYQV